MDYNVRSWLQHMLAALDGFPVLTNPTMACTADTTAALLVAKSQRGIDVFVDLPQHGEDAHPPGIGNLEPLHPGLGISLRVKPLDVNNDRGPNRIPLFIGWAKNVGH